MFAMKKKSKPRKITHAAIKGTALITKHTIDVLGPLISVSCETRIALVDIGGATILK